VFIVTDRHKRARPARSGTLGVLRRSLQETEGRKGHRARSRGWRDLTGLLVVAVVVLVTSTALVVRARRHAASLPEPSSATAALPSTPDTQWDDRWPRLATRDAAVMTADQKPIDAIRRAIDTTYQQR
jgi:hypothetical protein